METQKVVNFRNDSNNEESKLATKKNGRLLTVNQKVIIHTKNEINQIRIKSL